LETTSTRNDENKIELKVTIFADEARKHIDAVYREAAKARIPGFRPGKAPRRVLENHYGGKGYFQAQATDRAVKESLPLAIDAEGYVPLDKPEVKELDLLEEGKDYSYELSFTVNPLLELSSYEPVQIELPSEEPTDEEIEERIETTLNYYVDFEEVNDRPVQEDDLLTLGIEATDGSERIEGLSGDSFPYQLGAGGLPVSFDEQVLGMNIGETREFDITFPTSPAEAAGRADAESAEDGRQTHMVVTVKEIKAKIKPELTDAWVKETIEFDSVEEFKSRIADSLRTQKHSELESLREGLIFEEFTSRLEGEPPALLITQTEQESYRDFFAALQRSNQTLDGFLASTDTTPEAFRAQIRAQAEALASQTLALDALARHLGLEVTEEEIREEFESSGADDPETLYQQWKDNGRISELREGLLRMKASRHLRETVEVFEPGKKPKPKKATAKRDTVKKAAAKTDARKKATDKAKSTEKKPDDKGSATKTKAATKAADNKS
jgi:trigger factor